MAFDLLLTPPAERCVPLSGKYIRELTLPREHISGPPSPPKSPIGNSGDNTTRIGAMDSIPRRTNRKSVHGEFTRVRSDSASLFSFHIGEGYVDTRYGDGVSTASIMHNELLPRLRVRNSQCLFSTPISPSPLALLSSVTPELTSATPELSAVTPKTPNLVPDQSGVTTIADSTSQPMLDDMIALARLDEISGEYRLEALFRPPVTREELEEEPLMPVGSSRFVRARTLARTLLSRPFRHRRHHHQPQPQPLP